MGCPNAFIREFRQRFIDIRWQASDHHVNTSEKFSLCRQFKTLAGVEPYMTLNLIICIRYTLTRFIFGVLNIILHRSRFKVYNVDDLKCPLCLSAVDNFVLCCPAFDDLKYEFTEPKYFNNQCEFWLATSAKLNTVCVFYYKVHCAYNPSNGSMALLNGISILSFSFILSLSHPLLLPPHPLSFSLAFSPSSFSPLSKEKGQYITMCFSINLSFVLFKRPSTSSSSGDVETST